MKILQSEEEFNELIKEENIVMLFHAKWCKDCHFIDSFLPEIVEECHDYTFVQVDRDEFIDIFQEHDVFGIPSLIAFHKGEEIDRFVSKDRKTKEDIIEFVKGLKK